MYLGVMGQAVSGGDIGGTLKWVFFDVGLVATIIMTFMVSMKAKLNEFGVEDSRTQ